MLNVLLWMYHHSEKREERKEVGKSFVCTRVSQSYLTTSYYKRSCFSVVYSLRGCCSLGEAPLWSQCRSSVVCERLWEEARLMSLRQSSRFPTAHLRMQKTLNFWVFLWGTAAWSENKVDTVYRDFVIKRGKSSGTRLKLIKWSIWRGVNSGFKTWETWLLKHSAWENRARTYS